MKRKKILADSTKRSVQRDVFRQCQNVFETWSERAIDDFEMDDPKGFSSFTMGVRAKSGTSAPEPSAVLYRQLEGKDNAILDFDTERRVFLTLGAAGIAAHCHHYSDTCRIEAFYTGRTLEPADLFDANVLRRIANELYKLHQLTPAGLPTNGFFELAHAQWGAIARRVLNDQIEVFPANEQAMCVELRQIYSPNTLKKVQRCLPRGPLSFCHNDTYHGNIMRLEGGDIRLLDFEFSCLNHRAYDFANLFAETVMQHKQPDYPYFRIAEPKFGVREFGLLINAYLDNEEFPSPSARDAEFQNLLEDSQNAVMLSDFKYAMASLPLSVEPIQKIRFIPYAHARFKKFLAAYAARFGNA